MRVTQSSANGAPQCPTCWAHTMIPRADGTFTCPGKCPGHLVLLSRATKRPSGMKRFVGSHGDTFVLRSGA
ncbi:MAG: hypothetical protein Q7R80_02985 [bacterium]|nr:hypothetical protein [bacterium]